MRARRHGREDAHRLAAVAQDLGASALVSSDHAFDGVEGISHVVPDATGLIQLPG